MPVTKEELMRFKVVELKAKLSELGLTVGGLKGDLVDRLFQYYQKSGAAAQNVTEGSDDSDDVNEGSYNQDVELLRHAQQQQLLLQQRAMEEEHMRQYQQLLGHSSPQEAVFRSPERSHEQPVAAHIEHEQHLREQQQLLQEQQWLREQQLLRDQEMQQQQLLVREQLEQEIHEQHLREQQIEHERQLREQQLREQEIHEQQLLQERRIQEQHLRELAQEQWIREQQEIQDQQIRAQQMREIEEQKIRDEKLREQERQNQLLHEQQLREIEAERIREEGLREQERQKLIMHEQKIREIEAQRIREIEMMEKERQNQILYEHRMRELEAERAREEEMKLQERQNQLLRDQQMREVEAQRIRELEMREQERQNQLMLEQQMRELEAQRIRELEAQRIRELEAQRIRELEEQRIRELEAQRIRELEAQRIRELEAQRIRELEEQRIRELEAQRIRELEAQRIRELEIREQERQNQLMLEQQMRELEAQRIRELEAQRIRELEAQKIRELEAQRIRELEAQRIRELEIREQEHQNQLMLEQQMRELEAQRIRELEIREQERQNQLMLEQQMREIEAQRNRELEVREQERKNQLIHEQQMREIEAQRIRDLEMRERERQNQLQYEQKMREIESQRILEEEIKVQERQKQLLQEQQQQLRDKEVYEEQMSKKERVLPDQKHTVYLVEPEPKESLPSLSFRRDEVIPGVMDGSGVTAPAVPPPPVPPMSLMQSLRTANAAPSHHQGIHPPGVPRNHSEENEDHLLPPEQDEPELKLPPALELALAFKSERAKQVGVDPEDMDQMELGGLAGTERNSWPMKMSSSMVTPPSMGGSRYFREREEEEGDDVKEKEKGKRNRKKKKKKLKKTGRFQEELVRQMKERQNERSDAAAVPDVEIEYISEPVDLSGLDPQFRQFARIFETFRIAEPEVTPKEELPDVTIPPPVLLMDLKKVPKTDDDSDSDEEGLAKPDQLAKPRLSKRKQKLLQRMSVAELKQTVGRPDVVEMHDVTARDPKLLVQLKAARNTVPVPRHWCFKRKYLQGKRGIEKPPFELPDFIKRTGIMEMRAALQEKEDQKTLKAKMREKVRPKMGKIDIDYQKLHDAFFKWQCKPKMTQHGELYYEGKEFETKMRDKKPGDMSDDLRMALGMPVGFNAHKVPPPWLIAMQRYGPPPSYPNLKIPGLNAAIPDGTAFGYHAGGWGKPPVDNVGKPIYGDVFGTQGKDYEPPMMDEEVERTLWGELESESSESEEEDEEEDSEEEDMSGLVTPGETGLVTPSGMASLPAGLETPDLIELRKRRLESEMEGGGGDTPGGPLYTILPERRTELMGRAMMGSTHTYDLSSAMAPGGGRGATMGGGGVEVALDPSDLDLGDTEAMAARYEATMREQRRTEDDDFSDMVAEHAAKQRSKRRKQQQQEGTGNRPTKKYKDFKF